MRCIPQPEESGWEPDREEIEQLLDDLERSFWLGTNEELAGKIGLLPGQVIKEWARLAYTDFKVDKLPVLQDIIKLLEHPSLPIPHRLQIAKVLKSLKALVEVVPEIEEKANRIILSLRNGNLSGVEMAQELDLIFLDTPACSGISPSEGVSHLGD